MGISRRAVPTGGDQGGHRAEIGAPGPVFSSNSKWWIRSRSPGGAKPFPPPDRLHVRPVENRPFRTAAPARELFSIPIRPNPTQSCPIRRSARSARRGPHRPPDSLCGRNSDNSLPAPFPRPSAPGRKEKTGLGRNVSPEAITIRCDVRPAARRPEAMANPSR